MDGIGGIPGGAVRFPGPHARGLVIARGGFRPNGSSNPTVFRGALASGKSSQTSYTSAAFTVTYAATGLYTVKFTGTGWKFPSNDPPSIAVWSQCKDVTNTNRFIVYNDGGWDNTNRQFVIAAFQEGSAFAPPSDAGNWIDFELCGGSF